MNKMGFIKVAAITPILEVGNPKFNIKEMLKILDNCEASIAVFPELSVTGYTCQDLFYQELLLEESNKAILYFLKNNKFKGLVAIGAPITIAGSLFNTALIIKEDKILGIVPKKSMPNSKEFYEKRWFKSGLYEPRTEIDFLGMKVPFGNLLFTDLNLHLHIAVEICEDMWAPISPANILAKAGANLTINLSASNETLGKSQIRKNTVLENSRKNCGAYIYASAGIYESTSDTVYSGHNIISSCGNLIKETENFSTESEVIYADIDISEVNFKRHMNTNLHDDLEINYEFKEIFFELLESKEYKLEKIDQTPFVPKDDIFNQFNKIRSLQEFSLYKRVKHTNVKTLLIGVSGGLDSTLALLIACQTFKKLNKPLKDIIAVTMPGFATSNRTKSNAIKMMESLGVTVLEKPIEEEANVHFKTIEHDPKIHDVTYENTQARIRTMILMNLANKYNGLVLGTGDLSELALGWCTYNGDQMSMYGINAGIPKTMVRFMIECYANYIYLDIKDTLIDIVNTPISPELSDKDQKTEDFVGKYEVNDFILYRFLQKGDNKERIIYLLKEAFSLNELDAKNYVNNFFKRFFTQQFKRQALPDGPKILDISLAPRSDFKMPSDIKID